MSEPELESISDTEEENAFTTITEEERCNIREKLSLMPFEDLQKLKNEIGSKDYNKSIFANKVKPKTNSYKRENKNRPREVSSKIKPQPIMKTHKKQTMRDPRFDPLCGEFNRKSFKDNYKFLNDVRQKEKDELKRELEETTDPARKQKIKYVIQRVENQIREEKKNDKTEKEGFTEMRVIKETLKKGKEPQFKKKSVKKLESLISKYEELKKTNKVQKHIEKKSKKLMAKERRQKGL